MISGALEGYICIDVSGHVAGPYASSLLGDLGCDVIKVELPNGGDTHRGRNPKYEGYGPSFRALNRNKKSVTIDLRHKKGARNFTASFWQRRIFSLKTFVRRLEPSSASTTKNLSKLNPKLIHCSISGYGQSGPYRDKPGFDTIGQALSGMMSLVTDLDDPKVAGVSFVDHSAGDFCRPRHHGRSAGAGENRTRPVHRRVAAASGDRLHRIPCRGLPERRRSGIARKFSQGTNLQSARLRRQTLHGSSFRP